MITLRDISLALAENDRTIASLRDACNHSDAIIRALIRRVGGSVVIHDHELKRQGHEVVRIFRHEEEGATCYDMICWQHPDDPPPNTEEA